MGRKTTGVYPEKNGTWSVDRVFRGTRLRHRGFPDQDEADRWLTAKVAALRAVVIHGERPRRTFRQAAAYYLLEHQDKPSAESESYLLTSLMPEIGDLQLHQVHDLTLAPYKTRRLAEGRKHKTINLALGLVRRICNLAASAWRDEEGRTWLEQAPVITMLPLVGFQREPLPITWAQQRVLLPLLPGHLARMALFVLNTGVRDDVVCSLRWDWEIPVRELGISVFEVPAAHVKGRRRSRLVVCNSVAQSVVEAMRGRHDERVFVWRRERVKNLHQAPAMPYRPIHTMNNSGWQTARKTLGLADLHVHDLRHTVGMRLREAGVANTTISDILWHSAGSITQHYTMAQIVELHDALEQIRGDSGRWNKSLATLRAEAAAARREGIHPNLTQAKKIA